MTPIIVYVGWYEGVCIHVCGFWIMCVVRGSCVCVNYLCELLFAQ